MMMMIYAVVVLLKLLSCFHMNVWKSMIRKRGKYVTVDSFILCFYE